MKNMFLLIILVQALLGTACTKTTADVTGSVGRYTITARNKSTTQPLQIRMRNTGAYNSSVTGIFTSGFTGNTAYQIVVQVK